MGKSLGSAPKRRKKESPHKMNPSTLDSLVKKMNAFDSSPAPSEQSEPKKMENYFESLPDTLNPPEEELQFRKKIEQNKNFMEKHAKVFKCTKCQFNFDMPSGLDELRIHPSLGVLLCKDCFDYYGNGDFSLDDDGEDKYCRWCGEGGMLFGCSKCICGFCFDCIRKHFGIKYVRKVKKDNDWLCFLCNPKRLWRFRFICSLAVEKSKAEPVGNSSAAVESDKKACENHSEDPQEDSSGLEVGPSVGGINESLKLPNVALSDSDSSTDLEIWSLKHQASDKEKPPTRKRIYSSSSDESENKSSKRKIKKLRLSMKEARKQSKSNFDKSKASALERLEKVLKLSQQQLTLGANWSSKMLKKFSDPKHQTTVENLKDECQKIRWFLSMMSTYLIEFCNSVELVETTLLRDEGLNNANSFAEQMPNPSGFSAVLQFLSFVNNQINTFVKKGLSLPDIIQAEIYDDDDVIGLRKNVKSSPTSNKSVMSNPSMGSRSGTSNEVCSPSKANINCKASRNATSAESLPGSPSKRRSVTPRESLTSSPFKACRSGFVRNHKSSQQSNELVEVQADGDESRDEDSFRLVVDESSEPPDGDDDMTVANCSGSSRNQNNLDYLKQNKDLLQILEILENA